MYKLIIMPFSDSKKLFFIHIPKCGGTSIEDTFPEKRKYIGYGIFRNKALHHINFTEASIIYTKKWEEYTTFAIVRNPLDRFISDFNFINFCYKKNNIKTLTINEYLDRAQNILNGKTFDIYDDHFYLQSSFIFNKNNKLMVEHLFKLEEIKKIKDFLSKYDLELLHKNKNKNNDKVILSKKQLEKFYNLYKKDYELLDYKFSNE